MDGNDTIGKAMVENMGVAVGILFLSRLEPEICLGGNLPPPLLPVNVVKIPLPAAGLIPKRLLLKNTAVLI